MEGLSGFWTQSDLISRSVELLLLAMSVSSWVIILWKGWVLRRANADIQRGVAAFWSSASASTAARVWSPRSPRPPSCCSTPRCSNLPRARSRPSPRSPRSSRAACATPCTPGSSSCSSNRVVLVSTGATAQFIGLNGTVWGIFHVPAAWPRATLPADRQDHAGSVTEEVDLHCRRPRRRDFRRAGRYNVFGVARRGLHGACSKALRARSAGEMQLDATAK